MDLLWGDKNLVFYIGRDKFPLNLKKGICFHGEAVDIKISQEKRVFCMAKNFENA